MLERWTELQMQGEHHRDTLDIRSALAMHTNVRAHRGSTPRGHIGVAHESGPRHPPTHLWKLRLRAAGGKRGTQPMAVRASSTAALSAGVRAANTSGAAEGSLQAMEAGVPNPLHRRGSKH
jgi:hypothetical protein